MCIKLWRFILDTKLKQRPQIWQFFFISQPKHMLWVLKRTVSMRRFFWTPQNICLNQWVRKYLQFLTKLIQIFSSNVLPWNDLLDDVFFYNLSHTHHTCRGVRQCVLNCGVLYLTHARNNGHKNYNGISSPGPSVPSSINLSLKKHTQKT